MSFEFGKHAREVSPGTYVAPYPPSFGEAIRVRVKSEAHLIGALELFTSDDSVDIPPASIALELGAILSGYVFGETTGKQLECRNVRLFRIEGDPKGPSSREVPVDVDKAVSQPDASFSVAHLPPGRFRVQVLETRYMNEFSWTVDIDGPGVKRVEATVPTLGAIEGSVAWTRDPTETPVNVLVRLDKELVYDIQLNRQGPFSLHRLEPGTYHLTAEAKGLDGKAWTDSVTVQVERQQSMSATMRLTPR
jgi:hypothetical protein